MTKSQTAEAANESDEAQQVSTSLSISTGLSALGMAAIATALACVWILLSAGPAK